MKGELLFAVVFKCFLIKQLLTCVLFLCAAGCWLLSDFFLLQHNGEVVLEFSMLSHSCLFK